MSRELGIHVQQRCGGTGSVAPSERAPPQGHRGHIDRPQTWVVIFRPPAHAAMVIAEVVEMGMSHRVASAIGAYGEELACEFLTDLGYELVDRNWRCAQGELDIVARDGGCLVFCEVKTRRSTAFGNPVEAVTPAKAARLRRLAVSWLRAHDQRADEVRIDVVGVLHPSNAPAQVEHLVGVA